MPSAPACTGSGVALLEMTSQCDGAVTVKRNVDLRSGCSKTAKTRRESGTSNWVYRYTSPSTGSVKRCRPSPVFMYGMSASTTSRLLAASDGSWILTPSDTAAASSGTPFSSTRCTVSVTASMNVAVPGSASKETTVVDRKTRSPRVRSRVTS